MTNFVNLTPHGVNLRLASGEEIAIPSSGVARVSSKPGEHVCTLNGVPVFASPAFGPVEGLPEPREGDVFIVSLLVLGRPEVVGREDVVAPGTGPHDGAIRDDQGRISAVTRLIAAPRN